MTASTPEGATAALLTDWKAARTWTPVWAICLRTSLPTLPLAPVIRIMSISVGHNFSRFQSILTEKVTSGWGFNCVLGILIGCGQHGQWIPAGESLEVFDASRPSLQL